MNEEKLVNTTITEQATNGVVKTSITEPKPNEGTQSATVAGYTEIAEVEEMQKLLGIQKTEIEKLKSILRETYQFLSDAPELNMSNYDIDQVVELNNKMIEAYCNLNYNQSNFSA